MKALKCDEDLSELVSGDNTSVLACLGHLRHLASDISDRATGPGSLHRPGHTPRGESASGEALLLLALINNNIINLYLF